MPLLLHTNVHPQLNVRPQPDAHPPTTEYHRYFPDWTRQRLRIGEELEANHNSYLAGGYAEEFGYLAQAGASRGVRVIDGELPDECSVRLAQGLATHPGYPLRPYPIVLDWGKGALDGEAAERGFTSRSGPDELSPHSHARSEGESTRHDRELGEPRSDGESSGYDASPGHGESKGRGTFVPVTERPYERAHRHPAHRAAAAITRVLSSLVTLRWELRPLR